MPYTQTGVLRMGWFAGLVLATLAVLPLTLSDAATSAPVLASTAQAGSPPVLLGTADSFAVLAGTTITNIGPTVINGNLGLHPSTAVVGFPPGSVNGAEHVSDAVAQKAATDLTAAYNDAAGRPSTETSPPDIGGRTLTAGVYRSGAVASLGLTGRLTLDAQGDPGAVFIFQIPSTLITPTDSSVRLINGAQACNVFWQVGSSATLDSGTVFVGNVLAEDSITMNSGASITGRVLASNGAVTLDNNVITRPGCTSPDPSSGGADGADDGSGSGQVPQVPVGSVDAGDGTSVTGPE